MKFLLKLLFVSLLFLSFTKPLFAQNSEQIKEFNSDIIINKDGSIDVAETIVYDFTNLERHGIFRNIPYTKYNEQKKRFDMDLDVASVTDEANTPYKFTVSNVNEQVQIKIGDPNRTITGIHTYIISYKVKGALGYFKDHDELFWNITGNDWQVPILSTFTRISLPDTTPMQNVSTLCFTGNYGSKDSNCKTEQEGNTVLISTNNPLSYSQGLTVVIGFPKNLVAFLPPQEYVPFFERLIGKIVLGIIGIAAFIWYFVLPLFLVANYFRKGRDPNVGKDPTAWYDPPKISNRTLTPGETGALIDETAGKKEVFATIVDLARRGYLRIEEREKKDFWLVKAVPKKGEKLLQFENKLFDGLFPDGEETRLKDTKLYETVGKVEGMLYKSMVTLGFFPHNPRTVRTIYYVLGFFGLVTANFVLAFISFFFGRIMPRKTLDGARQAQVARSLKNFLVSQERQLEFQADHQMMFEKLLPYAVAFGVEKIWAKRFEKFDLKQPDWYSGYGSSAFNSVLLASSLSNSYSSFSTSATPPSSTGSGFGGGGFSGGGGGGGGGGSW